ncbi:MAG: hypothetical protein LBK26_01430 [Rickettsiales bacterium]|jgi:hypothetical protein|nr:hypothetical protein [Rickettsiales bacterium]
MKKFSIFGYDISVSKKDALTLSDRTMAPQPGGGDTIILAGMEFDTQYVMYANENGVVNLKTGNPEFMDLEIEYQNACIEYYKSLKQDIEALAGVYIVPTGHRHDKNYDDVDLITKCADLENWTNVRAALVPEKLKNGKKIIAKKGAFAGWRESLDDWRRDAGDYGLSNADRNTDSRRAFRAAFETCVENTK